MTILYKNITHDTFEYSQFFTTNLSNCWKKNLLIYQNYSYEKNILYKTQQGEIISLRAHNLDYSTVKCVKFVLNICLIHNMYYSHFHSNIWALHAEVITF